MIPLYKIFYLIICILQMIEIFIYMVNDKLVMIEMLEIK